MWFQDAVDHPECPPGIEHVFQRFYYRYDVKETVRECCVLQSSSEDIEHFGVGSQARNQIHTENLEVARRNEEEVASSAPEIEKAARGRKLVKPKQSVLSFPAPFHRVVNELPLPTPAKLGKTLVDSDQRLFDGPGSDIKGLAASATDNRETVAHHRRVEGHTATSGAGDFANGQFATHQRQLFLEPRHVDGSLECLA